MALDPAKLIPVAKRLPPELSLDKEARTRTAIGRAYYALFLATRKAICERLQIDIDNGIDHGVLTNKLFAASSETNNEQLSALAKTLIDLYTARQKADY